MFICNLFLFYSKVFNGEEVNGLFHRSSPLKIEGNEGQLKVKYEINEGKLVETITNNGFKFKQISSQKMTPIY